MGCWMKVVAVLGWERQEMFLDDERGCCHRGVLIVHECVDYETVAEN